MANTGGSGTPPSIAPEPAPTAAPVAAKPKLYLQPLGAELPLEDSRYVAQSLRAFFDLEVVELAAVPLPKHAFYAPRQRYRAERLLDVLEKIIPSDGYRILGLTGVDISTTKSGNPDWGILGLATVDGKVCVISAFRTKRQAQDAEHARIRLGKTAVHEIGHTLGLDHCPTAGCLMHDGEGSVLTTDTEYDLCERCRDRMSLIRVNPLIPWPRP
jgi:archaemetzincin